MDEEEDMDKEESPVEKHVAYKLCKGIGNNKEGDIVHLPEEVGKALCDAGHAMLASADDIDGKQDMEDEENMAEYDSEPVLAKAVKKLKEETEKTVAQGIAKGLQARQEKSYSIPAEPIQGPIYKTTGAYVADIMRATVRKSDEKLWNKIRTHEKAEIAEYIKKAPLGINESTNSQGGFTVNPQFSQDVYAIEHGQIDLLAMCLQEGATSNVFNQRSINESSLANGSIFGGLNMVATAEGASFTSSLPAWQNTTFTLQKEAVFVYYTTEVLQDSSYPLEAELNEYVRKAFLYGLNTQLVQGTTLEGLLNSPSAVSVTHSSNDTAWHTTPSTALTYADLASIWAQVYPDCQASPKGVWLCHPSLINPLVQMTYTFSGSAPAWGIQYDAQYGLKGNGAMTPYKLFGKDLYPCWAMSAPGIAGDIAYVDFNTVKHFSKPFRVEVSKEYQFGTDQIAVRFVARLDAKSLWRQTITGVNGTQTFSNIVTRTGSGT